MAITNVRTVQRCEVYPATSADDHAKMMVVYEHTFDDSTDDQLPIATERTVWLNRYTVTVAEDGTESSTATDVTGEDQLVQDICGAIWTD